MSFIPPTWTPAREQIFLEVSTVQSAQVISDRDTVRSKGFGFVEMSSDAKARAAIAAMSGKTIKRLRRPGANATLTPELTAAPPDIATCMYYTGIDPFAKQEVYIAKGLRDRKMQRALMQFFKPENYFAVREALLQAGRQDLIGNGCDCLIPAQPPKEAIEARRKRANDGDHDHTVANPAKGEKPGEHGAIQSKTKGYRPGRKSRPQRQTPGSG